VIPIPSPIPIPTEAGSDELDEMADGFQYQPSSVESDMAEASGNLPKGEVPEGSDGDAIAAEMEKCLVPCRSQEP
jgi:hypothetical protein